MKSLLSAATLVASLLLSSSLAAAEPIAYPAGETINDRTLQGCYKSSGSMEDEGAYTFQSSGYCRDECTRLKKPVMALTKGSNCYCGDKLPPKSQKTDKDQCQVKCDGYPGEKCGGKNAFLVFLTKPDVDVETDDEGTGPSPTSTGPPMRTITQSGQTIVVTAGSDDAKKDNGPNKAGIAAGVVVGVVALAAIVGGVFFYMKYKKRKEVVEEYRRNATINNFVAGGRSYSPSSDSRLEPSLMSQRRQSNGSIADDQDFSRRILKVTNPDSHY